MEQTENRHLLVSKNNGVMHLTLNRPDSLNAFSPDMMSGLKKSIEEAKSDDSIRVVTLSGAGRAFSAGGDVKTMGSADSLATYHHIGNLNELILAMRDLNKPIIAAVHGYAAGAGFNLALACDMVLAAEGSKFVLSFSRVGLSSDGGGLYFLPRLIGPYLAKELLFTAEPITAEKAHSLGIVNHTYPLAEFKDQVEKFADKIANGPSEAYQFMKKITNQSFNSTLDEILELERISQATIVTTESHKEGVQAFTEKREPNFKEK
ncbi:enoyl-CoA hydratase [Virgibacillus sp. MSP4-1]|uniref:enoyl-CoA hydratase/isomerase family protein n=1 Tax=Virgibacillus sp. MSP4-1 TaxID=2700081 RepID=UPI0005C484B9|nr:enoyl-CoA hydratase [Virgibacillus sp. MSP4-1]QHS22429.1 enoyl-CoA hydratase [Virgibacillus sp. MSP4-1]